MKEVTKEQFFAAIGKLDVHPHPEGRYPYVSYFKTRSGQVVGKIEDGGHSKPSRYFLNGEQERLT